MIELAASNIGWSPASRHKAYGLMQAAGFSGLEIAPGLLFPDAENPFAPSGSEMARVRSELAGNGLRLISMQSLLFGRAEASLFGEKEARNAFVCGMEAAVSLAGELEIGNLVFGSPTQRVMPEGLALSNAVLHAVDVFQYLGDLASEAGCRIAIEPNPAAYGTNFLNTIDEAANFVQEVSHPAIALNMDIGALKMNGLFEGFDVKPYADTVSHVHMSEPFLVPAPVSVEEARNVIDGLRKVGWSGFASIEMKAVPGDDDLAALAASVQSLSEAWSDKI